MGEGLVLKANGTTIGLDVPAGKVAYISHAHSDHSEAVGGPLPIFCTDPTAELLGLEYEGHRAHEKTENNATVLHDNPLEALGLENGAGAKGSAGRKKRMKKDLHQRMRIPQDITLHNAGHMLGSAQLQAQSDEEGTVVYTGDFKLRDGLSVQGAPIIGCDTLLMECTYGDPRVSFPKPGEVLDDMRRWGKQNRESIQIWGGYSAGKAQEVVRFLNDYLDAVPLVPSRIAQVCSIYQKHGVKLEWMDCAQEEAQEVMRDAFCAVLPPHVISQTLAARLSRAHGRKALTAIPTGWALVRPIGADAAFPLSDHADFEEILRYAKESGAKRVYAAHGDNENTARALRAAGIEAWPIEKRTGQQTLV